MVVVGLATTEVPVVEDKPVAGLQLYVLAPLAVSVILFPAQITGEPGDTVTVGGGFDETATVTVEEFEQPNRDVPVTVYAVVAVGLAVTAAPVVADKPVAGLQV